MKKLIKALLAWVVLIMVAIGIYFWINSSSDDKKKESREFAEISLKAISQTWDKKELINRSHPALATKITKMGSQIDQMFSYSRKLGSLVRIEKMNLDKFSSGVSTKKGATTNAAYTINAEFTAGKGKVIFAAIEDDSKWSITTFRISSDVFVAKKENLTNEKQSELERK